MTGEPRPSEASRQRRESPIQKYLGSEALTSGPLGLLGLTPDVCTDDRIVSSLEWQLDRVSQHPEGDTPEADEVRLALHAAAAQLLDRNVRRHVLERLSSGESGGAAPTSNSATSLEQDAILTLAMYGGWNKQSLQRLGALAHARGLSSESLADSLQHLATQKRKPKSAPKKAASSPAGAQPRTVGVRTSATGGEVSAESAASAHERDLGAMYLRNLLLGAGATFAVLAALLIYLAWLITGGGSGGGAAPAGAPGGAAGGAGSGSMAAAPQSVTPAPPTSASGGNATSTPSSEPSRSPEPTRAAATPNLPARTAQAKPAEPYVDPLLVVRSLRESVALMKTDSVGALRTFTAALGSLTSRWCRFDPAQRRAADAAVVDFIYASAAQPEVGDAAFDAVSAGASLLRGEDSKDILPISRDKVWASVWSVGLLTRLSRERELPSELAGKVEAALTAAIGSDRPRMQATFETGAAPALRRLPARILKAARDETAGATPPLAEWVEAVVAITGPDQDSRERLLADGLEQVLVESADPAQDKFVHAAIRQLSLEIKWRKGGPARTRLLAWFKDPRVSSSDLQVLTAALANQSSAEGVDPMMVLSVGASAGDRQRLRGVYVKAWGESGTGKGSEVPGEWAKLAREELARLDGVTGPIDLLEATVRLAELNDAATRLWRGETQIVADMLENIGLLADDAKARAAGGLAAESSANAEGDGRWLATYLSAGRNIPVRLERLKELSEQREPLGQADAELLVELACNESPAEVRSSAQRVVLIHGANALVVNALLEILPRAPRYPTVSTMLEKVLLRTLPNPADPAWELEARRALVERLLELLASSGEQSAVNVLAALLWESYRLRAGGPPMRDEEVLPVGDAQAGSDAASAMWSLWRQAGDAVSPNEYAPISLDVIDRRHEGRLILAGGAIQSFAAHQAGVAELMAYVVTAERPGSASIARGVVNDMSAQRRKAGHIFEQLAVTERSMLRLWLLRFEEADQ